MTTEEFIKRAKEIHGDKYDYSETNFVNWRTKVKIICPEHGEFWKTAGNHLSCKQGCYKCFLKKRTCTLEEFIQKAKTVHNDKYDYSKVEYINSQTKVKIICPEHGEFWQKPNSHLMGQGCPHCSGSAPLTVEGFVRKAKAVHGDKYDYSQIIQIKGNKTKLDIICPVHGIFKQSANAHLHGYGCPHCKTSYGEEQIRKCCEELGYNIYEDFFMNYRGYSWMGYMHLDCCFPKLNIAFEYDGQQHYRPVMWRGAGTPEQAEEAFKKTQRRDALKNQLCEENGVKLVRIPYWDFDKIPEIIALNLSPPNKKNKITIE